MENLKITPHTLSKISLIINKMQISSLVMELNVDTGNEKVDNQTLVKKLLALVIDNFYKAEKEIIELISELKEISIEEAKSIDVIQFIKDLLGEEKIKNFLKLM